MIELKGVYKGYKSGSFFSNRYRVVLKDIDLEVKIGEHLGIIGESGAGKTTLSKIISLLELPDRGELFVEGEAVNRKNIKQKRGTVGMVFQDPSTSLDPSMKIISTLKEASSDREEILSVFEKVGLKKELLEKYPYQLSGGEQQRVAIARALLSRSSYVIFDEFTSALDVSTQARIVNLLLGINEKKQYGFVFVSHDVKLIGYLSDRIYVIYRGEVVEELEDLKEAKHPYTKALINNEGLDAEINFDNNGCGFYSLCPYRFERCKNQKPSLKSLETNKKVRCFLYD